MKRLIPRIPLLTGTLIATLLSLSIPSAEGIVRRDDVDDQQYIDFGAQFPSVGMFSTDGTIRGSGTLISETGTGESQWVLTAAHLSTPNEFTVNDTLFTVAEFIRHPDWGGSGGGLETGLENDIALARLEMTASGITPLRWHDNDNDLQSGVDVVSVGFGRSGTGLTGGDGPAGTKRAAENNIDAIGSGAPIDPVATAFEYEFHAPGDPDVRALEGMGATFDSGGPVLADFGDGDVVVGVHSYVVNNDDSDFLGTYGDDMGSTRVPLYDEWITSTIPEPGTWALWGGLTAFAVVVTVRRRSRAE